MNDSQLLHQFVTHNSQPAFRQLAERHTDWLYSVCLRRLRDPSLAEDATQAVFLALAQKAPSLLHEPTLSPWLHQAAKFVAANILRARNRRTRHESEAAAMTPDPISSPPADWEEIETDLEPALDRLSSRDRQMILLRFYEQKSHPEIAAGLHISEAAAAKRLSRALERLRSLLTHNSAEKASLSSAAISSLLLSHSVTPAPPTLAASTAAVTVHTSAATLAKGAITAMALAKLQTAALITAACLLIAVPVTVITVKEISAAPPPTPVVADASTPNATAPSTTLADSAPDSFDTIYGLAPGQLVKRITAAPPDIRGPFLREKFGVRSPNQDSIFIGWMGNKLEGWSYMSSPSYTLSFLAGQILHASPADIEGDLAQRTIDGDFAFDASSTVTPDQRAAALQKILQDDLAIPAFIQFRDVPRKVIVFHGRWKFTPAPDAPVTNSITGPHGTALSCVDIYDGDQLDTESLTTASGSGPAVALAGQLGYTIHQQVLIEGDDLPANIGYRRHSRPNPSHTTLSSFDRTSVLQHITEQTLLTWSEETRPVRRLFITSTPAP